MATIGEHLAAAVERLRASGSESARLDAELLLAHALGVERTTILAHPEGAVGPEAAGRLHDSVERRAAGEPVAYIRGLKEFHGVAFAVDARALIPRPETEVLVDLALGAIGERLARAPRPPGTPPLTVADVGTGSGAIAVALAVALRRRGMLGEVEIVASDASDGAADLARENAVAQAVGDRVAVIAADLLPPPGRPAGLLVVPDQFDVVCANLPYIPSAVVPGLPVAASFEPRDALDGGPDGLDVIRRLLAALPERVAAAGVALLEIGDGQGPALRATAAERLPGWAVRLEPDLAGTPRVAVIEAPGDAGGRPGRYARRGRDPGPAAVSGRRIRLVALDLDGTLIGEDLRLPPRTTAAIRAAVERGVHVVLATGRMTTSALPYARELGLRAPLIGLQGALVREMPAPGQRPPGTSPPPPAAAGRRCARRDRLVSRGRPDAAREPPREDGGPCIRPASRRLLRLESRTGGRRARPRRVDPRAGHEDHLGGHAPAARRVPGARPGRLRRPRRPDREPPDVPGVPRPGREQGLARSGTWPVGWAWTCATRSRSATRATTRR